MQESFQIISLVLFGLDFSAGTHILPERERYLKHALTRFELSNTDTLEILKWWIDDKIEASVNLINKSPFEVQFDQENIYTVNCESPIFGLISKTVKVEPSIKISDLTVTSEDFQTSGASLNSGTSSQILPTNQNITFHVNFQVDSLLDVIVKWKIGNLLKTSVFEAPHVENPDSVESLEILIVQSHTFTTPDLYTIEVEIESLINTITDSETIDVEITALADILNVKIDNQDPFYLVGVEYDFIAVVTPNNYKASYSWEVDGDAVFGGLEGRCENFVFLGYHKEKYHI